MDELGLHEELAGTVLELGRVRSPAWWGLVPGLLVLLVVMEFEPWTLVGAYAMVLGGSLFIRWLTPSSAWAPSTIWLNGGMVRQ